MENIKGILPSGVVEADESELESDGSGELESGEEEVSESSDEEPPLPPPPPPPPKRPIIRSNKKHNNIIRRIPHRDFLKQKRKSEALKAFHKFSKKMKLDTGLSIKTIAGGDIVELDELLSDSDESFTKEDSESSDGLSESEFTVDPEAALEPEGENESYIDPETGAITIPGHEPIPGGPLELDNEASVASMSSVASADSGAVCDTKTLTISDIIEGGSEFDLDKNVDIEEILGANQFTIEKKKSLIGGNGGSGSASEQVKDAEKVTSGENDGNTQEKAAEGATASTTTPAGDATKPTEDEKNKNAINVRRNIREVMDEKNLDASTLAAQRQESERLARVQEQQRIIREVRRQIALGRQQGASLLKGANLKNLNLPGTVLMKVPPGSDVKKTGVKPGQLDVLKIQPTKANLTPSVSIAPVGSKAEVKTPKDQDKKEVVEIVDSTSSSSSSESPSSDSDDCIMLSDSELPPSPEPDEDPHNSGLHVNDAYNVPDEQGRVQINIGHPENEEDIFLAPQISRVIKPHQIGGVRFLFDNIIESVERFSTSTGFGCILAHSMGLGKTLQIVCFCDIFLRHTKSKTVLCIMPINTLQNWVAEFNMWLPTDASTSSLSAQGEVRCRNFPIFVLNDSHKTLEARAKIIKEWSSKGGVLMIGYELYRLLSLKKNKKPRNRRKKNGPPEPEKTGHLKITAESKSTDDKAKEEKKESEMKENTSDNDNSKKSDVNGSVEAEENKNDEKVKADEKDGEKSEKTEKEEDVDEETKLLNEIFSALVKPGPDLVICDEGHRIKNSHSNISYALKQMRTKRRVVLTGYPLQNNLLEYWCMVDFVRPNYLGTKTEFSNMFERPIQNGQCIDSTPQDIRLMRYRAHVLHSLLLGFVQRRSHAVLQSTLPQKEEYVLLVRMTDLQRKLYDTFMNEVVRKKTVPNPLKAFAVCCKIWNHPDVLYYFLKQRSEMAAMIDYDLDIEDANPGVTAAALAAARRAAGNNPIIKKPGRGRGAPRKNDKVPLSNRAGNSGKPAASIPPNTSGSTDYNSYDANKPGHPNGLNQYAYGENVNQHPNTYPYNYQQYPPQSNYYGPNNSYGQQYNNEYYPQQPYHNNYNQHYPPNPQAPNAPPSQHYTPNPQYNQQGYWGPDNNYYNHNNYYPNNQPPYQPAPDAYGNVYDPYGQQYQGYPNPSAPHNGPYDPNAPVPHRPYDPNVPNQNGTYNPSVPNQPRPYDPNISNPNVPYDPNVPAQNRPYDPNVPNPGRPYDPNAPNPSRPYDPNVPDPSRPYDPNTPNSSRPFDPNVPNPSHPYDPSTPNPSRPYDQNISGVNQPYDPNISNPNRSYDPNTPNSSQPYELNVSNSSREFDPNVPNMNRPYDADVPTRPYEAGAANGSMPHQTYPATTYPAAHNSGPPGVPPAAPIPTANSYGGNPSSYNNTMYPGYPPTNTELPTPASSDVKPILPIDSSSTWPVVPPNNISKNQLTPVDTVDNVTIKTEPKTESDTDVKIADLDTMKVINDVKSEIKVEVKQEVKNENVKVETKTEEIQKSPVENAPQKNVESNDSKKITKSEKTDKGDDKETSKKSKKTKEKLKEKKTVKKNKEKSKDDEESGKESDEEKKEEEKPEIKEEVPYEWANDLLKNFIPGVIENSAKMELLFCILQESIKIGDRLLLFSQSLFTLNLIEDYLQKNYIPGTEVVWARNRSYYRLDGSTSALEREKLINEYNSNTNVHLFLVSTRAGSLGINLVGANRVVVFDASWNPCHDTQAVCRVYRYGQQKPCFVYRFVMDNCLEKKIYDRQINKQGMSDRVVDECNPDAVLSMKEVTNLCWDNDEKETELKEIDVSCKDNYRDDLIKTIIQDHSKTLSKEPFQHESLLVDRKEKKLSSAEKRLAQRGYELEKKAAANPKPTMMYRTIRTADGTIIQRPVASVRPMQHGGSGARWIPAEVWQRQGMTAQEMTLPLDVVIPTNSAEKTNIVLKAGQRVMVLKSPKGIYMQLESGKIIAIKTSFKVGQKPGENANKDSSIIKKGLPSRPGSVNLPGSLKNNSAITVISKTNRGGMQKVMSRPNILNKPGVRPIMPMTRVQDMKVRPINPTMSVRGRPPLTRPTRPIPIQNNLNIKIQGSQNITNTEKEKVKEAAQQSNEDVSQGPSSTCETKGVKPQIETLEKEPEKQVETNEEFEEQTNQNKALQPSALPEDVISEDSSQEKTYVDLSDKSESKITTKPSTKKATPVKQAPPPTVMKDCKIPIKNSFLQNDSMPMGFLNQVTIKRTTATLPSPSTSASVSPAPGTPKPGPVNLIADEVLPSEATLSEHKLPSALNSHVGSADENSMEEDTLVKEKKIYKPNLVDRKTKINSLKNYRHQKSLQKPIPIQSDISISKMSPVSSSSTPTPPPPTKTPDKFESSLSRLEKTAISINRMSKPGGMSDFQQSLSDITRTYSPETSEPTYKPGPKSRKKKIQPQAEESSESVEALGSIPMSAGYGETHYPPQPIPGHPPADPYASYPGYPPTGGPYPPPATSYPPAPAPYPPPSGPPYYQGYPPAPYPPYHHPPQPYPPAPYPPAPVQVSYPNPNPNPPQWQ